MQVDSIVAVQGNRLRRSRPAPGATLTTADTRAVGPDRHHDFYARDLVEERKELVEQRPSQGGVPPDPVGAWPASSSRWRSRPLGGPESVAADEGSGLAPRDRVQ